MATREGAGTRAAVIEVRKDKDGFYQAEAE
jgi:hypothetical protein